MMSFFKRLPLRALIAVRRAEYELMFRRGFGRRERRYTNLEGERDYEFTIPRSIDTPGISAMIRAKNEESKIRQCLESIYDVFDEVVFIDNGSTDRTAAIVEEYRREHDAAGKIRTYSYPFSVARCGSEHRSTPRNSVRSLAYYYNYCLSRVGRRHVCKWDADMVVVPPMREQFRELLRRIVAEDVSGVIVRGQTVYRTPQGRYLAAVGEVNEEPQIAHVTYVQDFRKAWATERWMVLRPVRLLDDPVFYELKYVNEQEFSHWTSVNEATAKSRKRIEVANFKKVAAGETDGSFVELGATAVVGP
ncbi:MAG: glycosyltransferase family 2 protein [Planctomycetaceae bacterium]